MMRGTAQPDRFNGKAMTEMTGFRDRSLGQC
jgi:hypothetical protein